MIGEGLRSSLARDDAGPMVSDTASAAADNNALRADDLVNVRSVKSRSVARMSALPGYESIRCLAANQGRRVRFLINRTDIGQSCPTTILETHLLQRSSRPVENACSASALTGLS